MQSKTQAAEEQTQKLGMHPVFSGCNGYKSCWTETSKLATSTSEDDCSIKRFLEISDNYRTIKCDRRMFRVNEIYVRSAREAVSALGRIKMSRGDYCSIHYY